MQERIFLKGVIIIITITVFIVFGCDDIPMREKVIDIIEGTEEPTPGRTPTPMPTPERISETTGSVTFYLRKVPSGSYYVGDNPPGVDNVTLTRGYWIAETEVTNELWYDVYTWAIDNGYIFANPGGNNNQYPRRMVNWRDAIVWCNALSEREGFTPCYTYSSATIKDSQDTNATACDNAVFDYDANGYRLPTDVEWEVAARGATIAESSGTYSGETYGTTYAGSNTIDDVAWYSGNSGGSSHVVGTKNANELELFDMSGNVSEFCWDFLAETYPSGSTDPTGPETGTTRIGRGGNWKFTAALCTVSSRAHCSPYGESNRCGFRPVRNE